MAVPLVVVLAFVLGGDVSGGDDPPPATSSSAGRSGTGTPGPLRTSAPAVDAATAAVCDPVMADMPVTLPGGDGSPGLAPLRVEPGGPSILAWGDPLVVLRCGVGRPADLRSDVDYNPITLGAVGKPTVTWLAAAHDGRVTWTTVDRAVYLSVEVDTGDTGYVQTISDVIATALPAVCLATPQKGDPPGTVYCGDRP